MKLFVSATAPSLMLFEHVEAIQKLLRECKKSKAFCQAVP